MACLSAEGNLEEYIISFTVLFKISFLVLFRVSFRVSFRIVVRGSFRVLLKGFVEGFGVRREAPLLRLGNPQLAVSLTRPKRMTG